MFVLSGCSTLTDLAAYNSLSAEPSAVPNGEENAETAAADVVAQQTDGSICIVTDEQVADETVADTQLLTEEVVAPAEPGVEVTPEPLFDFPVVENDQVRFLVTSAIPEEVAAPLPDGWNAQVNICR